MRKKHLLDILYFVLVGIILCGGLGYADVFLCAFYIILALAFYDCLISEKKIISKTITCGCIIIASIVIPNYTFLLGSLLIPCAIDKRLNKFILPVLFIWLLQIIWNSILPIWLIFVTIFLCIIIYKARIQQKYILYALTILILFGESYRYLNRPNYTVESYPKSGETYKPGHIFQEITDCQVQWQDTTTNLIRSYAVGSKIPYEMSGACILEHDPDVKNNIVLGGKWQQPISWHSNVMDGSQYYREALSADGGLWSNIGTNLKDTCKVLLAFRHGLYTQPLIVQDKNVRYLHDSDYTSSYLSYYQQNFIKELFSPIGFNRPLCIRLFNILLLLCAVVVYVYPDKMNIVAPILSFILCLSILIPTCYSQTGNVRMVGKIYDSHENNRFEGVPKKMVEQGFPVKIGNRSCDILVVQENRCAIWMGESTIILEPQASVLIRGHYYKADEIPMGNLRIDSMKTIQDARSILYKGEKYPYCDVSVKDKSIEIYATGSPAQIDWMQITSR